MPDKNWNCGLCGSDVRDGVYYSGNPPEHSSCRDVKTATKHLSAEVSRLREALEAIADGSCYDTAHDIRLIARAALSGSVGDR